MRKVLAIIVCFLITIFCSSCSTITPVSDQATPSSTTNKDVSNIEQSSDAVSEDSSSTSHTQSEGSNIPPSTSNKQTTPSKEITTESKKPSNPTSSVDLNELPSWKRRYINYAGIRAQRGDYNKFALVYLNDDDIPELYMYGDGKSEIGTAHSDGNSMIGIPLDGGGGGGSYVERSGNFMNIYPEGNMLVMRIYTMEGPFIEVFCGKEDKTTNPPTYYIDDYMWQGTEEEFKNVVSQYIDVSSTKFLHSNALSYDEFKEKVINW